MNIYENTKAMEIEDSDIVDGVLRIPEGINRIMIRFASNNEKIKKIILPSTLLSIGAFAFVGCKNLEIVDCTKCSILTKIGGAAFLDCSKLSIFDFSCLDFLEEIEALAFSGTALLSVGFKPGTGPFRIKHKAFSNCQQLITANLGWRLNELSYDCFSESKNLQCVSICSTDELTIGESIFYNCTSFAEFTCYGTFFDQISKKVFEGCPEFTLVTNEDTYILPDNDAQTIARILLEDNL